MTSASAESRERACGHVRGVTRDVGEMLAVVHADASALVQPQAG